MPDIANPIHGSQEDLILGGYGPSWRSWRVWTRRQMVIGTVIMLLATVIVAGIITCAVVFSEKHSTPTPAPITTTTTAATTTTTTPTTTTTSTTTTTTTTSTTTTPTTTTTSTTTKPTTTTSPTTTTTTPKPTTTTPSTTTTPGPFVVPTSQPIPADPTHLPAVSLLYQVLVEKPDFKFLPCKETSPLVFKSSVEISHRNFTGEAASTKKLAKEYVARVVAKVAFNITYPSPVPPQHPCELPPGFELLNDSSEMDMADLADAIY